MRASLEARLEGRTLVVEERLEVRPGHFPKDRYDALRAPLKRLYEAQSRLLFLRPEAGPKPVATAAR